MAELLADVKSSPDLLFFCRCRQFIMNKVRDLMDQKVYIGGGGGGANRLVI